ncbi:MAG: autotransporter outer membrane beta-barrel domain-containing protein [Myxococcota bacterium]
MRSIVSRTLQAIILVSIAAVPVPALADLIQLTTVDRRSAYDDLERSAARANQRVFEALEPDCNGGIGSNCTVEQFGVFAEVRELVETANEILANGGPTAFSLSVDDEGLGNALRWTAAEEVAAQSSAATDFADGQNASVRNRITALRLGARGFSIAGIENLPRQTFDDFGRPISLLPPVSAKPKSDTLANLGGFMNASYGWGSHDPTNFENAFDFEGYDLTAGLDYRFRPDLAAGIVVAYSANELDFDGSKSIVDGGIDSQGFSVGAFATYSWRAFYVSGFLSYQRMEFDINRFITYPSLNPDVDGTNTRTKGETDSNAITGALNAGYLFRFGLRELGLSESKSKPFVLEPSFRIEFTDITIAAYDEDNITPDEYFALKISEQEVQSVEATLGLRASVAVSTPLGVLFPYVRGEWRFELEDETNQTVSQYAGIGRGAGADAFVLSGEEIDTDYGVFVVGAQVIVRGGRQRTLNRAIGDRLSAFFEYRKVVALDDITNDLVNGGVRYLF